MRWGKLVPLVMIAAFGLLAAGPAAFAGCASDPTAPGCLPTPPPGTPTPATPAPTTRPAPTKTPSATHHTVAPPVQQTVPTDQPTQAPVELASPVPSANITVPGPAFNNLPSGAPLDTVHSSASLTTWIFGFIAGFLIGALVGRASWGVSRRRRKSQIFG